MFTGITRGTFAIARVERGAGTLSYDVELTDELVAGLQLGASVAIDGVCQTVVRVDGVCVRFDAIGETLDVTTLDTLEVGRRVSVERSYKVGDEIGDVTRQGDNVAITLSVPPDWMRYILDKGFVAIDGSSLTVASVDPAGTFDLHLIPETLRLTNLGSATAGQKVNVELDHRTVAIVDTVERVLASR